jgi:hypothetical protein
MTKEELIQMAREAGFERVVAIHPDGSKTVTVAPVPELETFANLVANHEREECAKLCLETEPFYGVMFYNAIRARGNT